MEAFRKAFRGVYRGDLLPLIRHVSGWIQWLLEEEWGGWGGWTTARRLIQQFPRIPTCSAHSSPSPSDSFPSLFLETSHSRESGPSRSQSPVSCTSSSSPRRERRWLTFLCIQSVFRWFSFPGSNLAAFTLHLLGKVLDMMPPQLASILIWSAAVLVPLIDDLWVDWYVCQLHFECTFSHFTPVLKNKTLDRMELKLLH